MNGENFSDAEKQEARKNGFILAGKTGTGKSTLLNAIIGEEIARVEKSANSVTQETTVYYYKLNNGRMITILDTPGLMDPKALNDPNIDNVHLKEINEKIWIEKIQIKGIIFLVNFQNERFDLSEQEALINYNKIFPLQKFWKHIFVIFTHYFADPDGDTEEEMKKIKDESNRIILGQIMEKVKNVSDVIDYNSLTTKYFNSYCPVKTEKQKAKNEKNKKELEIILEELSQKEPLFSKIELVTKKNFAYKVKGRYYKSTLIIIGYFGLAKKPFKEERFEIDKVEISNDEYLKLNKESSDLNVQQFKAERDKNGEINTATTTNPEDSYYMEIFKKSGIGGLIGVGIGVIGGVVALFTPIGAGMAIAAAVGVGAGGGGLLGAITGFITGIFSKK